MTGYLEGTLRKFLSNLNLSLLLAKHHNIVLDEDNIASKELSALYKKTGLEGYGCHDCY